MKTIIEKLDNQGRGISFINGKITFIDNALPGEEVEIKITKENSKIIEAEVINYIKKSDIRINEICPYGKECGGCNLLHMNYSNQLKYKYEKVVDIMSRFGNISSDIIRPIIGSPLEFEYRNKITLKVDNKVGYYKNKTNNIIHIDKCLLANEVINNVIYKINSFGNLTGIDEIVIKGMSTDEVMLVLYVSSSSNYMNLVNYMKETVNNIIVYNKNKIVFTNGKSNIIARLHKKQFKVNALSFFQVNLDQTINLYDKVLEYVKEMPNSKVLDLYCGTGSIGQYISDYCEEIIGVEIIKEAIDNAKENALINNISNSKYYVGDTKVVLANNKLHANIIIVDPPRAGLDKEVIDDLFKINSERIIYVSCDPITLARDLKLLSEKYIIREVTPFDMFPNTYHVETVCVLDRK